MALAAQFCVAGEISSLPAPMPTQQAFENLKANKPTRWLVRMVPYDPANPELRIDHLKMLGGPVEDYTFVADYEEVRGYTASEAVYKSGGAIHDGQGVSAVLFPIGNHTIFPASVRGMLQVVQQIDMRRAAEPGYRTAPLDVLLTDAERTNLAAVDLQSWAWNNYRQYFPGFAHAFANLRNKKASAIERIGPIGPAWCEPGCSQLLNPPSPAYENLMTLELADGTKVEIRNFGIRLFLIRNVPIDSLPDRKLIDFNTPHEQRMPYLDLSADARPATLRQDDR